MGVSKILKNKTAEDIQHPAPTPFEVAAAPKPFEVAGQSYPILPMPDGILVSVTQEIGGVAALLMAASSKSKDRLDALEARQARGEDVSPEEVEAAGFHLTDLSVGDLVEFIPQIIHVLLPSATKIIAASLRQPEAWVQDTLFYRDRLRALRLILEAEDVPQLSGELLALVNAFSSTILSPGPASTI